MTTFRDEMLLKKPFIGNNATESLKPNYSNQGYPIGCQFQQEKSIEI